jgi:L-lactate dehydrogenase complex protein LldG
MRDDTRQKVLANIRRNLQPVALRTENTAGASVLSEVERSATLRGKEDVPLLQRFGEELRNVGGSVVELNSGAEAVLTLVEICRSNNFERVVLSREPLLEELQLEDKLRSHLGESAVTTVQEIGTIDQLRRADVGITACEFLISETGTVLLRSSPVAPRALSLLPRAHIIVAREEQLVPTFAASLEKLQLDEAQTGKSSCITLVTGPSRTADIEKVLVKGVHGPKDLAVVVLRSKP